MGKYFRAQKDGKDVVVTVDRLKLAFTLLENIPTIVTDTQQEIDIPVQSLHFRLQFPRYERSIRRSVCFS